MHTQPVARCAREGTLPVVQSRPAPIQPAQDSAAPRSTVRRTVALIMPALNEARSVEATFDAIFASTRLPDEIVVADGFSADDTIARVDRYKARGIPIVIVNNDGILPGAGRNAAVEASTADIALLLDFGNTPDPLWIEKMVEPFEQDPRIDIVAGLFHPAPRTPFEHCIAAIHYHRNLLSRSMTREMLIAAAPARPTPGGLSVAYRRQLWTELGGQPTWLRTCEDVLFSRKALDRGATLYQQPDAISRHHMRDSLGAFWRQIFLYSRGHGHTRVVSFHCLKLVVIYAGFAILAGIGLWQPIAWVALAALFATYAYRTGIRKLRIIDGRMPGLRASWHALGIVIVRDVATLAGHAVGWWQLLTTPRLRRLFDEYVGGTGTRTRISLFKQ